MKSLFSGIIMVVIVIIKRNAKNKNNVTSPPGSLSFIFPAISKVVGNP